MNDQAVIWEAQRGNSPLLATAIHNGHRLRREVAELTALNDAERLREEDPFTGKWTTIAETRIIGTRSRFEVDLNRPRDKAVYLRPDDAWGLRVWKSEPSRDIISRSLTEYDAFYAEVHRILIELERKFGRFVVFDLHSYNHRREGPDCLPADADKNPEVNVGTGTMDRSRWASLVDRFISDLRDYNYGTRRLDVRENIKFKGGHFSSWIHQTFPRSGCSLAIEFKKFFMDEWTGKPDRRELEKIQRALKSTVPGVLEELQKLESRW